MIRNLLLLACVFGSIGALAQASPIQVNFVGAELPPNSTTTNLPVLLGGGANPDIVFLKFKVPDIANVLAINSFIVNVTLFDNSDGGGEMGNVAFAQPGPNVPLFSFTTLNHIDSSNPLTVSLSLCPCTINQVFPSLLDGTFRIRVSRQTGTFFVGGGSATIDATMIPPTSLPEPPSVTFMVAGLGTIILLLHVHKALVPANNQ